MTDQQLIGADLRSLERHKRTLETLRDELTSPLIVMGPGSVGRKAVWCNGGRALLSALIDSYDAAIKDVTAEYDMLESAGLGHER